MKSLFQRLYEKIFKGSEQIDENNFFSGKTSYKEPTPEAEPDFDLDYEPSTDNISLSFSSEKND